MNIMKRSSFFLLFMTVAFNASFAIAQETKNTDQQKTVAIKTKEKAPNILETFSLKGSGSLNQAQHYLELQGRYLKKQQTTLLQKEKKQTQQNKEQTLDAIKDTEIQTAFWKAEIKRLKLFLQKQKNTKKLTYHDIKWPSVDAAKNLALRNISPSNSAYKKILSERLKSYQLNNKQNAPASDLDATALYKQITSESFYKKIESKNIAGQTETLAVGFIINTQSAKNLSGRDKHITASIKRGLRNGLLLKDTAIVSALNVGYKGAFLIEGNKLSTISKSTPQHIAILLDTSFSKLTLKQIEKLSTQGFSLIVINTNTSNQPLPEKKNVSKKQNSMTHISRGKEYLKKGHPDLALKTFEDEEKKTEKKADLLLYKSESLRQLGFYRKAWDAALLSKKLAPTPAAAYKEALSLIALGVGKQSVRVLRSTMTQNPNNNAYLLAYGQALVLYGEYGFAQKTLTRVLQQDAWNEKAYLFRAIAWRGMGYEAKARADLTMATYIAPNNAAVRALYKHARWTPKELHTRFLSKETKGYSAPDKRAPTIQTFSKGEPVEVTMCKKDWCRVENEGSFGGYLLKNHLK